MLSNGKISVGKAPKWESKRPKGDRNVQTPEELQAMKERIYRLSENHTIKEIARVVGRSHYYVSQTIATAPRMMLPQNVRDKRDGKKKTFDWNDFEYKNVLI